MSRYVRRPRTFYSARFLRNALRRRGVRRGRRQVGGSLGPNRTADTFQNNMWALKNGFPRFKGQHGSLFPDSIRFDLKFTDTMQSLPVTAGGLCNGELVYRLGSIFDPRFAAGGDSVTYFTTLSNVYQWYQVYYVDITVTLGLDGAATQQIAIMLQPPDSTYTMVGKSSTTLASDNNIAVIQCCDTANQNGQCFRKRVYLSSLSGLTKNQWTANFPTYGAQMTNPTKSPSLRIGAFDLNGNADTSAKCFVTIVYYGRAWGRLQPEI